MNNTTPKKSNEIENSKIIKSSNPQIFESSTFSSTKLNPQIIESSLLTLSYTGGGVQPNFSAVGINQQFSQSNAAKSAVGKKLSIDNLQLSEANCPLSIVNCKLSTFSSAKLIVHYPLLILLCLFFSASAFAEFGGGTGSAGDPYIISSLTHLNTLADNVNGGSSTYSGKYFKVTADIDGFAKIIGNGTYKFSGNFDGDNHTINLNINVTGSSAGGGLFGQVSGAVIKNVVVTGTVAYNYNSVAGIVGQAKDGSLIENCINYATFDNANTQRAGIAGGCYSSTIRGCKNYANIVCSGKNEVAGIVAYSTNECIIEACVNYGSITGAENVAGIVAHYVVGDGYSSSIIDCENNGAVSGARYVGGCVGQFQDNGGPVSYVTACTNTAVVTATGGGYTGGVVGNIPYGRVVVDNCINSGNVIGTTTSSTRLGGLVGRCTNPSSIIRNSYNTGNVNNNASPTSSTYLYMGGLVGELVSQVAKTYLYNCYNIGDVKTNNNNGAYIGGLVGGCNGNMMNCYNGGTVSNSVASSAAIAGNLMAYSDIQNCYSKENCGTGGTISIYGLKANIDVSDPVDSYFFSHINNTTNTLSTSIDLLTALNNWVDTNGDTYLTWGNASSESDNKGMPKFYSCTPVPDPSLSVTQTNTGGRELRVSWTATDGVSYTLYYGVNDPNSGLENVYNAGTQTSPYNALRLTNGVEYHFAIKPTGSGDYCADNPLSSTVSATPECNE